MDKMLGVLIAITLFIALFFITAWIKKWQYRTSFAFGRIEHASSRLLFISILVTCIMYYINAKKTEGYFLLIDVLLWIFYFIAHSLEKVIHPKQGGRRL